MPSIGPLELVILLVIVLLIFGPKRLPGLGRQLGGGMREFRDSITGRDKDEPEREDIAEPAAPAPALEAAPAAAEREAPAEERRSADA
ncbi:MAG: twin-arginine translocase TatA/TatE family subunit [Solirubrobacteraceae bacterium]|jgi:sec-independent protein translocase protein TatA|nr:twin-arginine translocase TatA/TatE family subunit [Solirubrobacteraceae bacterium]